MRHYCSLTDINYLPKLLVMHESLLKHSSEPFTLYVLALDDETVSALIALKPEHVAFNTIDHVRGLAESRGDKTWPEFCWSAGSNYAEFLMRAVGPDAITYLDADLMFFSDPKVIFDEIDERSIAVIPHRFIRSKKHLEANGKFNVSWVTFKNDPIGRECLSTWAWQCREKCSASDGCGDQRYLDQFPIKYGDNLCVVENIGAGLAPWNLANYNLSTRKSTQCLYVDEDGEGDRVVFYHYHELRRGTDGVFHLTNYLLRPEDVNLIYVPYMAAYVKAQSTIESLHIQA